MREPSALVLEGIPESVQYNTIPCHTIQYNTVQYNTNTNIKEYNTIPLEAQGGGSLRLPSSRGARAFRTLLGGEGCTTPPPALADEEGDTLHNTRDSILRDKYNAIAVVVLTPADARTS